MGLEHPRDKGSPGRSHALRGGGPVLGGEGSRLRTLEAGRNHGHACQWGSVLGAPPEGGRCGSAPLVSIPQGRGGNSSLSI